MLVAYFDDSGTHSEAAIVSWGGFINTDAQWKKFEAAWHDKLTKPLAGKPRIRRFSLADCQSRKGEFIDYNEAESDLLQNEMRQIIVDHKPLGMAYSVDCRAWDRLVSDKGRAHFGDAETVCFSACFEGAINRATEYFPNETALALRFDQGRKSPKLEKIIERMKNNYSGLPQLVDISFETVEKYAPLQAADVIATENYWNALSNLKGETEPRPHLKHFLQRVSTEGYILDAEKTYQTLMEHNIKPIDSSKDT